METPKNYLQIKTVVTCRERLKKIWVGYVKIRFIFEKCKIMSGEKNLEMWHFMGKRNLEM